VVVADRKPISGGSRWATGAGLKRGIPVFRLDSTGTFHRQPRTTPCRVDWPLECSLLMSED